MKVSIFLTFLLVTACEQKTAATKTEDAETSQVASKNTAENSDVKTRFAMVIPDSSELPTCEKKTLGLLLYDVSQTQFFTCDGLAWAGIDLRGAQGLQGEAGAAGADGTNGSQGVQGATGSQGATGAQGAQGDKGDKGDTGAEGPPGTPGGDHRNMIIRNGATILGYVLESRGGYLVSSYPDPVKQAIASVLITTADGYFIILDLETGKIVYDDTSIYYDGANCTGNSYLRSPSLLQYRQKSVFRAMDGNHYVTSTDAPSSTVAIVSKKYANNFQQALVCVAVSSSVENIVKIDLFDTSVLPDFESIAPIKFTW